MHQYSPILTPSNLKLQQLTI